MSIFLQRIVVNPITTLTQHVVVTGQSGDLSKRFSLVGKDEVGILGREFDHMLEQLADAQRKLAEQSYFSGMAEMATGAMHNIRNTLAPMIVSLDRLRNKLAQAPTWQVEMARSELVQNDLAAERKADLKRFLELAVEQLATIVREAADEGAAVSSQADRIEEILSAQDEFARHRPLVELTPLVAVVDDALSLLPEDLRNRFPIEVDSSVDEVGGISVQRILLMQVFAKILTNAIEALQEADPKVGKVRITVNLDGKDGKEMVHVRVSDNGVGIEPADLEHIFDRGFSHKPKGSHQGSGLHWSANALNAMNGCIYAESDGIGKGTCMHLWLPRDAGTA